MNVAPNRIQRRCSGKRPQDYDEGAKRHGRTEQPDANGQRALDEQSDVFGNALVGIVSGIAEQLHAIMRGSFQPVGEVDLRHPAPPADLQPLIQIKLIDLKYRGSSREEAVIEELGDEDVPVPLLQ